MPAPDKTDRNKLLEAQAATLDATNEWLQQTFPGSGLKLELIARSTARSLAQAFNAPDMERLVDWDWEQLFFRKIQHQKTMWMFGITVRGRYGAACLGTINIASDYVSIEYLERHPKVHELSRLTALIAIQYIQALAIYLDMDTVRISDPAPCCWITMNAPTVSFDMKKRAQYDTFSKPSHHETRSSQPRPVRQHLRASSSAGSQGVFASGLLQSPGRSDRTGIGNRSPGDGACRLSEQAPHPGK